MTDGSDREIPEYRAAFARVARERRLARGLSQAGVADQLRSLYGLEVDSSAITRIEKGQRRAPFEEAAALAMLLGFSLDEVVAPHPGDLDEQIHHVAEMVTSALIARAYWDDTVRARTAQLTELRARREQAFLGEDDG